MSSKSKGQKMVAFWCPLLLCVGLAVGQLQGFTENFRDVVGKVTSIIPNPFADFPQLYTFKEEYDFIIVGCGASGSILANRLTQVSSLDVLCIEAGQEENALVDVPLLAPYLPDTPFNWGYKTTHQDGVCEGMEGKRCVWPRGKGMGGSSLINYMMYTRGNAKDYDTWEKLGNPGWGFNDIEKYFKAFENYRIPDIDVSVHGTSGELDIQYAPYQTSVLQSHLESAKELNVPVRDINGKQQIGMSRVQGTIRGGKRVSGAQAFLVPIRNRANLHVAKNCYVTQVNVDPTTKVATGVVISLFNKTHTVRARKEVILSGGSLNSPQLLMLSGVGPADHLTDLGIEVIQDLPVGKRLQDHVTFAGLQFIIDKPVTLVDVRIAANPLNLANYTLKGEGPFTITGGVEAYAFLNTRETESDFPGLPEDVPDIELIFPGGSFSGDFGQGLRNSLGYSDEIYYSTYAPLLGKDGFAVAPVLLKPQSVGYMELNSKDPFEFPNFYPNYYTNEADLKHMLRGIRWALKFGLSSSLKKFNPILYDKPYEQCAQFPFNSDDYWMCSAKLLSTNLHHQVGTCKMGPDSDSEAVVDPQLRVKGIKNLRVVDASIIPEIPSGHTVAASYIIGAKAADLIKQEYGL